MCPLPWSMLSTSQVFKLSAPACMPPMNKTRFYHLVPKKSLAGSACTCTRATYTARGLPQPLGTASGRPNTYDGPNSASDTVERSRSPTPERRVRSARRPPPLLIVCTAGSVSRTSSVSACRPAGDAPPEDGAASPSRSGVPAKSRGVQALHASAPCAGGDTPACVGAQKPGLRPWYCICMWHSGANGRTGDSHVEPALGDGERPPARPLASVPQLLAPPQCCGCHAKSGLNAVACPHDAAPGAPCTWRGRLVGSWCGDSSATSAALGWAGLGCAH
eukprot:359869-Chlamydomonas_euryale.AAC.28